LTGRRINRTALHKINTIGLFLILLAIQLAGTRLHAQDTQARMIEADTIKVDTTYWAHSPRKAAMLSAVLPGSGQIYNRKYWKVPIVYLGMGGLVYGAIWNSQLYDEYFDKYKYMTETGINDYQGQTLPEVEFYKNRSLRYKNMMLIFSVAFYALQIVDANVDAHLLDYDISEDISLVVDPVLNPPSNNRPASVALHGVRSSVGLKACLNF